MWALFTELGPFFVGKDEASLDKNPYSWHKNHNIIFIDNPVGTGRPTKLHNFLINFIYIISHMIKNYDLFYARKDTSVSQSVSQVTDSVWTTELHFTVWDRIIYARNRDHTDLEVDTPSCAVVIRQVVVKCSS
jgi:hypothetical protein